MNYDIATRGFAFNIEAISFIECFCYIIDFKDFQFDSFGLLVSRRNSRLKQFFPNTFPLVMRMNDDHSYK